MALLRDTELVRESASETLLVIERGSPLVKADHLVVPLEPCEIARSGLLADLSQLEGKATIPWAPPRGSFMHWRNFVRTSSANMGIGKVPDCPMTPANAVSLWLVADYLQDPITCGICCEVVSRALSTSIGPKSCSNPVSLECDSEHGDNEGSGPGDTMSGGDSWRKVLQGLPRPLATAALCATKLPLTELLCSAPPEHHAAALQCFLHSGFLNLHGQLPAVTGACRGVWRPGGPDAMADDDAIITALTSLLPNVAAAVTRIHLGCTPSVDNYQALNGITSADLAVQLGEALAGIGTLAEVDVSGAVFMPARTDEGVIPALLQPLSRLSSLTALAVCGTRIVSDLTKFGGVLMSMPTLRALDLSSCRLGLASSDGLANVFSALPVALRALKLDDNRLSVRHYATCAAVSQRSPGLCGLTHLSVRGNHMLQAPAAAFASLLTVLSDLQWLDLGSTLRAVICLPGEGGAPHSLDRLAPSLLSLTRLCRLDMDQCTLGPRGASTVAEVVAPMVALTSLNLNGSQLGTGVGRVVRGLETHGHMQRLLLGNMWSYSHGHVPLHDTLRHLSKLHSVTSLDLSSLAPNSLPHVALCASVEAEKGSLLAAAVRAMPGLQCLCLGGHALGAPAARQLGYALQAVTALSALDVDLQGGADVELFPLFSACRSLRKLRLCISGGGPGWWRDGAAMAQRAEWLMGAPALEVLHVQDMPTPAGVALVDAVTVHNLQCGTRRHVTFA